MDSIPGERNSKIDDHIRNYSRMTAELKLKNCSGSAPRDFAR